MPMFATEATGFTAAFSASMADMLLHGMLAAHFWVSVFELGSRVLIRGWLVGFYVVIK